jgi:hypothetical protein
MRVYDTMDELIDSMTIHAQEAVRLADIVLADPEAEDALFLAELSEECLETAQQAMMLAHGVSTLSIH